MILSLTTPVEVAKILASRVRRLRLNAKLKQTTLAERAGVSLASLRRFEQTGLGSVDLLLRLSLSLGRLDEFLSVLAPPPAGSIEELEKTSPSHSGPKRGKL